MNRFAQAWARLTGSTSAPAIASNEGGEGVNTDTITLTRAQADQLDTEYQSDIADAKKAGIAEGQKAAHDRFNAVLDSDAGKANPIGARTLLSNDKLSAEEIIAMLPNLGTTGGSAEEPEGGSDRQTHLDRTPRLDLAPQGGSAAATASGGGDDAKTGKSTWASVQKSASNALTEGGMRGAVQAR